MSCINFEQLSAWADTVRPTVVYLTNARFSIIGVEHKAHTNMCKRMEIEHTFFAPKSRGMDPVGMRQIELANQDR